MPTFNQLVRSGRKSPIYQSQSPALQRGLNTLENKATTLFADHDDISAWARDSVYTMAAYGVISGVGGNRFAPRGQASREQAIVIASRSMDKIPSGSGPAPRPAEPQPVPRPAEG